MGQVKKTRTLVDEFDKDLARDERNLPEEQVVRLKSYAKNLRDKYGEHMSAAGALGLPALLEARRLEYGIVDQAFEQECLFDRVYVWQVPRNESDTYENTMILRPDQAKRREEESCPRGVIVSAGLKALDNLRSNGVDLGHVISFVRMSPWRMPIGNIAGVEIPPLLVMRDGDLISSLDLAEARKAGKVRTIQAQTASGIEHRLEGPDGCVAAKMPWMSEDY